MMKHIPIKPPRDSVPLEGIYLSLWQKFAEKRPDEWRAIFRDCPTAPRQRTASVAASFMTFMGCNGGRGFTTSADQLAATNVFHGKESAYLATWALENDRVHYVNGGMRTIEFMLSSEYLFHTGGIRHGHVNWNAVPVVTMDDHDTIECMVKWWAGTTAHVIRETASTMLTSHMANEHMMDHLNA